MHAYLVDGQNDDSRKRDLQTILEKHGVPPYAKILLTLPEERKTIGIREVRNWITLLSVSQPGNKTKAGIICPAETLTVEAQNALLKTLEEPPPATVIILETASPGTLLSTVRSRCTSLRHAETPPSETTDSESPPPELTDGKIGSWINWVDRELKTRDDALLFVDNSLRWCQNRIRKTGDPDAAVLAERLMSAKKNLMQNANHKLTMDGIKTGRSTAGQAEIC